MRGRARTMLAALLAIAGGCAEPGASDERRSHALVWGGEQKVIASDAAELDQFGWSVALATDHALVGAYGETNSRGAAYAFTRSGSWVETQKLVASDGSDGDSFGWSVAVAGDRALVGAYATDGDRGAAYVFRKSGGAWIEEQKLVAGDRSGVDNFGWSVSLGEDRALVSAYGKDSARGATYVFVRSGSVWTQEQKLVASDGVANDQFGWSVSIATDGAIDRAMIGAPATDDFRGAAYAFARTGGGSWVEEQKLVANEGAAFDTFGSAVALAGDRALVGEDFKDDLRGAAHIFVRSAGSTVPWTEEQTLVASDRAGGDRFGNAVALAGDRAVVGAYGRDGARGAAYVFARGSDPAGWHWTEEQRLVASDSVELDMFGWSVALADGQVLGGAGYNDQLRGAAYAFSLGVEGGDAGAADADVAGPMDGGSIEVGKDAAGSCSRGDDCTSGSCEDGICCDRTCTPSERCRADLKVSGEDGTCGPAKAAAPGAPCSFDVQCTSGHCAGSGAGAAGACCVTDCALEPAGTGGTTTVGPVGSPATGDGGCACRAGPRGVDDAGTCLGLALAFLSLALRRRLRRVGE